MTLYEKLKAEYEATTEKEWYSAPNGDIGAFDKETGLDVGVVGPLDWESGGFLRLEDSRFCVSAHEKGYPLLMAVFEAAVEMLAAERANTAALAEYRSCVLTQEDLSDGYRERVNSRERFHAAKLALAAALAPLLAEAE